MRKYAGPVQYIGHHAIIRPEKKEHASENCVQFFISLSGNFLNEYWLKDHNLLRDLFSVLLRFRERPIAVCGDILKMYHPVLIPEVDQHVHRYMYLWRDLQT